MLFAVDVREEDVRECKRNGNPVKVAIYCVFLSEWEGVVWLEDVWGLRGCQSRNMEEEQSRDLPVTLARKPLNSIVH